MILSGKEIEKHIGKEVKISPYNKSQLNPNSYNLRLHEELLTYDCDILNMKTESATKKMTIPESGLLLRPNKLYLGRTVEYTETDQFVPMLEGRSSIGRLGLFVHITAGFGDVGFKGYWTLEMYCIQPIVIYPNVEICQVYFHTIQGDYEKYSSGKYQNNDGIQPSLLYKEFETDYTEAGAFDAVLEQVEHTPTVEVATIVHGHWIEELSKIPRCSKCGEHSDDADRGAMICPWCGARME